MGEMQVPDDALYGASTQRAVLNFPVSGRPLPPAFIQRLGLVKSACAVANEELGLLSAEKSRLIQQVAQEVIDGNLLAHFPVDVFQTGSATSSNMNINEVIANRASQLSGHPVGSKKPLHPNDDVNLGQSSNDIIPTALHVSVAVALQHQLVPALEELATAPGGQGAAIPRHREDRPHPSHGRHAAHAGAGVLRLRGPGAQGGEPGAEGRGRAGGTGHRRHGGRHGHQLPSGFSRAGLPGAGGTHRPRRSAKRANHFEAQGGRDDCVEVAGHLATIAASLTKIANDIRLLGSGPRAGSPKSGFRPRSPAPPSCRARSIR